MKNTLDQFYVFLGAVYGGIIIGIWYDALRLLRIAINPKTWVCAVFDVLFWAGAAFLYFIIMFDVDNAQIRFYPMVGSVIGFVVYLLGPSRIVMRGFSRVAQDTGVRIRRAAGNARRKHAEKKALKRLEREAAEKVSSAVERGHGREKNQKAE